jgi:hypothetical protein
MESRNGRIHSLQRARDRGRWGAALSDGRFRLGAQTKRLWSDEARKLPCLKVMGISSEGQAFLTDGRQPLGGDHP